jgi:hypothetical protein
LATHRIAASVGLIWQTLKLLGLTLKNVWPAPTASGLFDLT